MGAHDDYTNNQINSTGFSIDGKADAISTIKYWTLVNNTTISEYLITPDFTSVSFNRNITLPLPLSNTVDVALESISDNRLLVANSKIYRLNIQTNNAVVSELFTLPIRNGKQKKCSL